MAKKVNPKRKPVTQADVDRAYANGTKEGCGLAMAIFFTVILDKFSGEDYIEDIWKEAEKLSAEIKEHRINLYDLVSTLELEYGINIK